MSNRVKVINGVTNLTAEQFNNFVESKKRSNKYNNIRTVIDGFKFDSKREANIYQNLKLLEEKGNISNLQRQVPFVLYDANKPYFRKMSYIADFTYTHNGTLYVIDAKGVKTPVYKIKKRLMYERYGILIKEM